jgi:DNA-binding transcriptional MerR regulator
MAGQGMRVDDLAREAGVATTTIRLYQSKGLLPPPTVVGRTGYYDDSHLARLRSIARLQQEGFSLAGIGALLDRWQSGAQLADLLDAEEELGRLLGRRRPVELTAHDLVDRFPEGSLQPELVQRAAALGLVEATESGRFRVPDARFLDTGAALAHLGVPLDVILDEWEHLAGVTDGVAERFAALFEDHLLPEDWRSGLSADEAARLATTLGQLRANGEQVLLAALDATIARLASERFIELLGDEGP